MQAKRVIIVGAGFAGVELARSLAGAKNIEVTLISEHPHLEYYPGVFRLMRGAPREFAEVPLVDIFDTDKGPLIINASVTTIDPVTKTVTTSNGESYTCDYLALSVGSQSTYFDIPGAASTTLPMRRGADVIALMRHIEGLFRGHASAPREEQVVAFRFVVVGGGPSGVELAVELATYTHELAEKYHVHPSLITIDLIESKERVLGMLPVGVSEKTEKRLRVLGVSLHRNRTLVKNDSWTIELSDAYLGARTVVWTAGVEVRDEIKQIPGFTYGVKGRISVDEYMCAVGYDDVFVMGDIADTPFSGLAQTAIRHARHVAKTIKRISGGASRRRIHHHPNAFAIPLGTGYGIVGKGKFFVAGFLPWVMRSVIDFHYLVGITNVKWVMRYLILPTIFRTKKTSQE